MFVGAHTGKLSEMHAQLPSLFSLIVNLNEID